MNIKSERDKKVFVVSLRRGDVIVARADIRCPDDFDAFMQPMIAREDFPKLGAQFERSIEVRYEYEGRPHECGITFNSRNDYVWIRLDIGSTLPKASSPYPHSCPRCGESAYVGLFEVTHAAANSFCPARSK